MISLIITTLLSFFCCSSVSINTLDHKKEIKPKEIIYRDSYYMMGAGERDSLEALRSIQYWATNIEPYYSGWAQPTTTLYNEAYNLLQNPPDFVNNNLDNIFYISQVGSSGAPTTIFNARRLRLISMVINQQNARRWYYYIGFGNDGNYEEYGIEWNVFTDITGSIQVENREQLLFNSTFIHWTDWRSGPAVQLDETDYAFSFMNGSTLSQMFYAYINSNEDIKYTEGYINGFASGSQNGYQEGYYDGLNSYDEDSTILTIFSGILEVGMLPINVFLMVLNFDVFGINIAGLVTSLLTISIVVIIIRFIFGGKAND